MATITELYTYYPVEKVWHSQLGMFLPLQRKSIGFQLDTIK